MCCLGISLLAIWGPIHWWFHCVACTASVENGWQTNKALPHPAAPQCFSHPDNGSTVGRCFCLYDCTTYSGSAWWASPFLKFLIFGSLCLQVWTLCVNAVLIQVWAGPSMVPNQTKWNWVRPNWLKHNWIQSRAFVQYVLLALYGLPWNLRRATWIGRQLGT